MNFNFNGSFSANILQEKRYILFKCNTKAIFFFKQKTAYEITTRLVGSEMCIRDRFDGIQLHTVFYLGRDTVSQMHPQTPM